MAFNDGWQGSRKGQSSHISPHCGDQRNQAIQASIARIKQKQSRLNRLLEESQTLQSEIARDIEQLGKPRQKGLPFIAYALKHAKYHYRG